MITTFSLERVPQTKDYFGAGKGTARNMRGICTHIIQSPCRTFAFITFSIFIRNLLLLGMVAGSNILAISRNATVSLTVGHDFSLACLGLGWKIFVIFSYS